MSSSALNKIKVADFIVLNCLLNGACNVFTVTGGGAMHLNDAFARNKKIKNYYFHHEQAASIAAEGFYRQSGKIAIVNVTTGPGGVNALNGVYGAFVDSIPMVVISGQVKRETIKNFHSSTLRQLGDQEVDITSMVRDITKFAIRVDDELQILEVMNLAFKIAKEGRPGPVWIDVPIDIQGMNVDPKSLYNRQNVLNRYKSYLHDNTLLSIKKTANLQRKYNQFFSYLNRSKKPILLVGNGIRISDSLDIFNKFLDFFKLPVITGWNAHDLIVNNSKLFAGRSGSVGDRAGNFNLQNADLVIILGCRLNIRQISYNWQDFAKYAKKIMVDIDLSEMNKPTLNIDLMIKSDLKEFLSSVLAKKDRYLSPNSHKEFLKITNKLVKKFPIISPCYKHSKKYLNPYLFLRELFLKIKPGETIVTANGSACVMGFQAAYIKKNQRLFTNSGCASMGYDLPASIGASIAKEGGRVICISGDGSIMMNIQELQTIIHYCLPIKIFIINNNGYASIRQTQNNYFSDNIAGVDKKSGVSFPSFVKLANSLGIKSIKINNSRTWSSIKVLNLLKNNLPIIFDVYVDPDHLFLPKLQSRVNPDGSMSSPSLDDMFPFLTMDEKAEVKNLFDRFEK